MLILASLTLSLSAQSGGSVSVPSARVERPAYVARDAALPLARPPSWTLEQILDALRFVETGGEKHGGRHSTGDSGGAIGPYQIHRAYWIDARLPGRWEDCRDPRYARAVVLAYWRRYCPKALEALDAQTLARIHNGGPDGARENATLRFWRKVERELVRQQLAREQERSAREASARRGEARAVPSAPAKPAPTPPPARLVGWA